MQIQLPQCGVCVNEAANHRRAGSSGVPEREQWVSRTIAFDRTMADDWGFNKYSRSVIVEEEEFHLASASLLEAANPLLTA
jgi:hypothetical protein